MRERSLKKKLIIRNTMTLSGVFVTFLFVLVSVNVMNYQDRLEKTREESFRNLVTQGSSLITDKEFMLPDNISYNSYSAVNNMVKKTMETVDEIVFGGYVAYNFKPWSWIQAEDTPQGRVLKVTEIDRGNQEQKVVNSYTQWALQQQDTATMSVTNDEGQEIYLFSAPVYLRIEEPEEELDGPDLERFEKSPREGFLFTGAIIYGLTTANVEKKLAEEEEEFKRALFNQITLLAAFGLLGLGAAIFITQRQAATITQPLEVLTDAADTIARGDYNISESVIAIKSSDELQTLARSFGQMAHDINQRDDELKKRNQLLTEARNKLEDLNRHLEDKVEERTKQLKESESKFRTLFEESADAILVSTESRFLDCNPALLYMLGVSSKDHFLSMTPTDIAPREQPDGSLSEVQLHNFFQLARSQGSQHFEWMNRRVNGEVFPTEVVITSFPLNGERVLHMVLRDITERRKTEEQLRITQQKLVETAHSAGMAEIATGVLHNIGNILNSVNISTEEISGTLKSSKLKGFLKANEIIEANQDNLNGFFTEHPKGRLIPGYFLSLGEAMKDEHRIMSDEIDALSDKVTMMRDVISTQQNYAKATLYTEDILIGDIIEDALKLQLAALRKQGVKVVKDYRDDPRGSVPKVKLVHVLTNLIKNGKEAMFDNDKREKSQKLVIEMFQPGSDQVEVRITDNGCGILPQNLDKIFNHGFTTKEGGHGFGLHTCANFMTEMGGSLFATSPGENQGSTFHVRFPLVCRGPATLSDYDDEEEQSAEAAAQGQASVN